MNTNHPSKSEAGRTHSPDEGGFVSKLGAPRDRFLAAVVEHALLVGRRSAKDFLRAFPPREIMNALRDQPRVRAKLLVTTTGLNEKIALKKPASSAGEDLEIALFERVTEEDDVVALFDPDDRVRYLDGAKLWGFLIEGDFWRVSSEGVSASVAREHVAFILSRARAERLLSDRDIIDGIGLDVLVESLPKQDLGRVIEKALSEGRSGRVFKDERVLDVVSPYLLVEHVPLAHLWERLITNQLAFKPGEADASATVTSTFETTPPEANTSSPALEVSVESEESIVIEERDQELSHLEVEAMLSGVGGEDATVAFGERPVDADSKGSVRPENGTASNRPSQPPPS